MKRGLNVILSVVLLTFLISPVLYVSAMERAEPTLIHDKSITGYESESESESESEVFDIIINWYDNNMSEEEKAEVEAGIRTMLSEYYLNNPEIIQEHLDSANLEIVDGEIEEWIPDDDYLQYIERAKNGIGLGNYIVYDLEGNELFHY